MNNQFEVNKKMQLAIYEAVEVVAVLEGGSTKPLIMRVINAAGEYQQNYVVKVFRVNDIEQNFSTHREFYVNALAREFDLSVPKVAIIKVDSNIIAAIKKLEAFKRFELQEGYYFGSEYLENAFVYDVTHFKNFEKWDLETIFAFDALIRNIDRRTLNPNILLYEDSFCLIDHELTFLFIEKDYTFNLDPSEWAFLINEKRTHLFYSYLKGMNEQKTIEFNEFREYLNHLNLSGLVEIARQLTTLTSKEYIEYREDAEDNKYIDKIVAYLEHIKQHQSQFINLLTQLLT